MQQERASTEPTYSSASPLPYKSTARREGTALAFGALVAAEFPFYLQFARGVGQEGLRRDVAPAGMGLQQEEARKVAANGAVVERVVRYMECRKNHAASVGGYAVDGCREFMASGADGTADALRCAACGCHRSFHRREVQTLPSLYAAASSSSSSSPSSTSRR